jgi:tetratricopeptide (TPR) repeat protein
MRRQALVFWLLATTVSVSFGAVDDRSVCGAAPPKSDTIGACTRIIASPATSPHDRALAYLFRANAMRAKGNIDGAISDYGQAIELVPNFALAYRNRGALYVTLGDPARAIADLDNAVRLDPRDASALYARGLAKRKNGDQSGGDIDVAAAEKLDPAIASKQ